MLHRLFVFGCYDRKQSALHQKISDSKYSNEIKQRIAYLSILTDAKQEAYDAVEAKYDLGYAIFSEGKEAEMQKIAVSLQKETAEEQLDFYLACIELRGGEYQEELLAEELAPLDKDYFQIFSEQGIQAYSDGAADVDYEIQWKEYVMNLELQYNTLRREVLQYDNELEVMQMKIDNNKALMEAGKAVQSSFTELKADQQRLQYERSSKVCEGQLILYILEHGIKNQTVSYSL